MSLSLRYAAMSHVGLLRSGNEDSVYAGPRLLAVADGMGGRAAGEVASAVAIASVAVLDEDEPGADLLDALRSAATGANDHVRDMVAGDAALEGMGTTLTTLLFTGNRLGLLHIGDSRCYLLRDGALSQITHDDTLVQSLVDEGRLSEDEASHHPQRSLITRALDGRDDIDFDTSVREVRAGDRYLLCSDGLTGPVGSRTTLQETLATGTPREAVERLVDLALRGGGPDNITVIVADVVDRDADPATSVPVVAGAAADRPQPAPSHLTGGAAGRAAAAKAPVAPSAPPPAPAGRAPRQVRGPLLAAIAVIGVLVLAAGTGWAYVRSQWYVGLDGDQVSVYRGVSGSVAGLDLAQLDAHSDLTAQELSELDRQSVERGIAAEDRADADRIVTALRRRSVLCTTPPPTSTATPTAIPTGVPTTTTAPAAPGASPATGAPTGAPVPSPSTSSAPAALPAGCAGEPGS